MKLPRVILALQVILALPAAADWIQTKDGARVETRGEWKVKGSLVVFTSKGGTLSSLRLSEVDLDASAVATFEAKQPPAPPANPSRPEKQSILVLTDKDIGRAAQAERGRGEGDPQADADASQETGEAASGPAPAEPVTVTQWQEAELTDVNGIEVNGTLQNHAANLVTDVRVLVRLRDQDGEPLGVSNAFLGALSLAPGATTKFRAVFPDVSAISVQAEFEVRSHRIDIQIAPPQKEANTI